MADETSLDQIQLPSVASLVYDAVRREILLGRLAQNEQLNLSKLEQQLGVSRTPLKMALSRLEEEGLIEISPRRGTYVRAFSERDIRECYELRIALEVYALRHVFEPQNAAILAEITELFRRMDGYFDSPETYVDDIPPFADMDRSVHAKIVELAGNTRMTQVYERANVQGYIALMGSRFEYADTLKTVGEHQRILRALEAHDLDEVLEAGRLHLVQAGERAVRRLAARQERES
ncbi:MAG: GntR family transcriptional regulator [Chloroflexi bacterium]|nr:GntR family transcriptional regulator [Chloroflexota bacterium]